MRSFFGASSKIKIIPADVKDIDLLSRIIRTSHADVALRFNLTSDNCPRHPSNCTADWIDGDMNKGVRYFILFDDKTPAGCMAVEKADSHLCYMERLSVLPDFRHQGFGSALVEHALFTATQWGGAKDQHWHY